MSELFFSPDPKRTFGYDPLPSKGQRKTFVAYLHFVGWDCISLGAHVCVTEPNIEVHLPFCFIRIGWTTWPQPYVDYYTEQERA